jgi:YgiT-type zinc finger domain-containing protein
MTYASGEAAMVPKMSKCFRCGSTEIEERIVEEFVRQGSYVVAIRLDANVCRSCGEKYFEHDDALTIEDVRKRLERGDLAGFKVTGELLEPLAASR